MEKAGPIHFPPVGEKLDSNSGRDANTGTRFDHVVSHHAIVGIELLSNLDFLQPEGDSHDLKLILNTARYSPLYESSANYLNGFQYVVS